jgi:hypothetical protein
MLRLREAEEPLTDVIEVFAYESVVYVAPVELPTTSAEPPPASVTTTVLAREVPEMARAKTAAKARKERRLIIENS